MFIYIDLLLQVCQVSGVPSGEFEIFGGVRKYFVSDLPLLIFFFSTDSRYITFFGTEQFFCVNEMIPFPLPTDSRFKLLEHETNKSWEKMAERCRQEKGFPRCASFNLFYQRDNVRNIFLNSFLFIFVVTKTWSINKTGTVFLVLNSLTRCTERI